MVAPFPIVKLFVLAVRQISKPLANSIKNRAKKSKFFRTYVCMPPAQIYHYYEVNIKMKMLGFGKPIEVKKLNEAMAIDLGAELLGEFVIFTIAAATLTTEYMRQSRKQEKEIQIQEKRFLSLEEKIKELEYQNGEQFAKIKNLTRFMHSLDSKKK